MLSTIPSSTSFFPFPEAHKRAIAHDLWWQRVLLGVEEVGDSTGALELERPAYAPQPGIFLSAFWHWRLSLPKGILAIYSVSMKCSNFAFKRWAVLQGRVHFPLHIVSLKFKPETSLLLISIICFLLWLKYSDTSHSECQAFTPIPPQLRNFSGNFSSLKAWRDYRTNGNIVSASQGLFLEVPKGQFLPELREASPGEAGTRKCVFQFQNMELVG